MKNNEGIEIVKWQEGVNLQNFTRQEIFGSIQEIDHSVFHENGLATQQSDIERYEAYKDSYLFALHEGKIIGYLCYFPITETFFQSVIDGIKVYDGDIASTDICHLNDNSNYIFILSVAISPEYQKKGIAKQFSEILINDFSKIKISDMVSYAFTAAGEHFLNFLGLKSYKNMEDGIKLMRSIEKMTINDNFDLILAIPCRRIKGKKNKSESGPDNIAASSLEKLGDSPLKYEGAEYEIKNAAYDNKTNLMNHAETFSKQIDDHGKYEVVLFDESSNIEPARSPLLFGQVILYKDKKNIKYIPECCYNFFAVLSELTVKKGSGFENDAFNIVYFVVPDINYHDLTLLMDQSHELWCNIMGNAGSRVAFTKYLCTIGYKDLGKIYRIVFSDLNQFETITKDNNSKLFNILAAEEYKDENVFNHQIELSENANEYSFYYQGKTRCVNLSKKEKFFDDYNMYKSYKAYASICSYYYVINEKDKESFANRIAPDESNAGFSSEANILFILEIEIFKVAACLVLSEEINEQMNNPRLEEIQEMIKRFINVSPLFEKLNYRYLGAQKEADFIYKQFRISDILNDYDRKRELLKSYTEITSSITADKNAKILSCIGMLFTFIGVLDLLALISTALFDNEKTIIWNEGTIIPVIVSLIIIGLIIKISGLVKLIKMFFKDRLGKR